MLRDKLDETKPYKPGQIVTSGSRKYQADAWGVLQPVESNNKGYIARKKGLMKGVN